MHCGFVFLVVFLLGISVATETNGMDDEIPQWIIWQRCLMFNDTRGRFFQPLLVL